MSVEPAAAAVPGAEDRVAVKALTRVFAFWNVGSADAAKLAGVSERTWSRMRQQTWTGRLDQDERMRASGLIGLYKALHIYFGDELADRWPTMANAGPLFQGASPLHYMLEGGVPAILATRDYVDALRGGV